MENTVQLNPSSLLPAKKRVNGEMILHLGDLRYKYLYTMILKSGDEKEYYKCSECPARLQFILNKQRLYQSKQHEFRECATKMSNWKKEYERQQLLASRVQEAKKEAREELIKEVMPVIPEEEDSEEEDAVGFNQSAFNKNISSMSICSEDETVLESGNSTLNDTTLFETTTDDADDDEDDEDEDEQTLIFDESTICFLTEDEDSTANEGDAGDLVNISKLVSPLGPRLQSSVFFTPNSQKYPNLRPSLKSGENIATTTTASASSSSTKKVYFEDSPPNLKKVTFKK